MAELLAKFRIDYQDVIMLPDITKKPMKETLATFKMINDGIIAEEVLYTTLHMANSDSIYCKSICSILLTKV
jgi:hypothetical protein